MSRLPIPLSVRRLITSNPRLVATLCVIALIAICTLSGPSATSPNHFSLLPSSWRPYPPPIHSSDDLDPPSHDYPLLDLAPLPSRYFTEFPGLTLSSTFDAPHLQPLARKLHSFLNRPGWDTEQAIAANEEGCPRRLSDKLVNPDQYNGDIGFWNEIDQREIVKRRAGVVRWLETRIRNGEEVVGMGDLGQHQGKGIVLTGGNQDTTLRLISVLKHLKRLHVALPIEVFHYPDELHDLGQRREIESLGAVIREVQGVRKQPGAWKNWQIKGLAMVQSSFQEILYLDSDNTPLRDPSHLFAAPLYLNHGHAVFWPDLSKDHPENAIWRIVGDTCSLTSWSFESGQILIDKSGNGGLNLAALLIAAEMQAERDFWFRMCGGDKDTFRWAFRMLGIEFAESPRWMSALGFEDRQDNGRFCGHTVLQYDLIVPPGFTREPPLFVHSNLLKTLNGVGLVGPGSLFTHVKRMSDDTASSPILNHAHSSVYRPPHLPNNMCLDLEWHESAHQELSQDELDANYVELIPVGEVEGGVFEGFEDAFFEEGGRIGGW